MGLHYFHANMTLEMVCCSAGIWGVRHLIASSDRVCVHLCIFICKLTYLCVCAGCLFFQFILVCFIYSSSALCDPGMCCRRCCGILLQWVQMLCKGLMPSPLNCHLKSLNQKHCTPKSQNTVANPSRD